MLVYELENVGRGRRMPAVDSLLSVHSERELLRAHVSGADDCRFAVTFDGAAGEHSYVRFALHYYARVLYEIVRTERSARDLPAQIDRIANMPLVNHADLFELAGVHATLCPVLDNGAVRIDPVLCSRGGRELHLRGDFSHMPARLLTKSVPAVLQAILPRLTPDAQEVLAMALANMNASYGVTHRYSDENSLHEVPANAYLAASFV